MRDLISMMLCCDYLFFNSSDWCISILAVHSVICSLGGSLSHGSPVVVFFDGGHPRFWNFYSTIPVDVVREKSYINCLFDPARVVTRVTSIIFTSFQSGLCKKKKQQQQKQLFETNNHTYQ